MYKKSEKQKQKELQKVYSNEQKRIRRRIEYLSNAGKQITIDGIKWRFLLNPQNDRIIMVSENGSLAKYEKWLKHGVLENYYTQITNRGYVISAQKVFETCLVHRLVALAFIPNPNNFETVDHKDSNKQNNHYSNLQWMTRSSNGLKAIYEDGSSFGNSKSVRCIETQEVFPSARNAEIVLGYPKHSVMNAANPSQLNQTAGGYHWEYI